MSVYAVYADGRLLYSSVLQDPTYAITDLKCTLSIGEEGSAEFTVLPTHRLYYEIHRMRTRIKIFQDDELIFSGRVIEATSELDLQLKVTCEGDFALLLDSVFGPYQGNATIREFLEDVLANHNSQVDDWKQFTLGDVTVTIGDTPIADMTISFDLTGYSDSKSVLTGTLSDVYGGYFQTRVDTVTEQVPKGGEAFTNTLQVGSRGENVKLMQQRLIDLDPQRYSVGSTGADGIFGNNTKNGLMNFQTDNNLTVDGIYNKDTHNALLAATYGGYDTKTVEYIYLDYLADPYYTTQKESTSTDNEDVWNAATDVLRLGSRGEKVSTLQSRLKQVYVGAKYNVTIQEYMKVNGVFDEYTEYGVTKLQRDHGIKVNYTYDKATHEALISDLGIGTDDPEPEETTEIEPTTTNSVRFGVNLVNLSREYPISDIFTVLLPLGDNDITISSVNNGSPFLENATAVKEFGRIVKTFTWSKATTAKKLKEYADEYLKSHTMIFPDKLTVTAIDLHLLDSWEDRLEIGDWVEVVSRPHNLDVILCCLEIQLDIQTPENTQYVLGYYIPSNFDSDTSERVSSTSGNISRR